MGRELDIYEEMALTETFFENTRMELDIADFFPQSEAEVEAEMGDKSSLTMSIKEKANSFMSQLKTKMDDPKVKAAGSAIGRASLAVMQGIVPLLTGGVAGEAIINDAAGSFASDDLRPKAIKEFASGIGDLFSSKKKTTWTEKLNALKNVGVKLPGISLVYSSFDNMFKVGKRLAGKVD